MNTKLQNLFEKYKNTPAFLTSEEIISVNQKSNSDETILNLAIILQNKEDVIMLLENGAEINAKGEDGFTAIQNACFNWNIEIIKILLENKANPFLKNDLGYDVFYYASEENHGKKKAKKIIQLLKKFDKN